MKIKLIVFDLDGTLYNLNDIMPSVFSMEVDYLSNYLEISNNEAVNLLNQNGIFPYGDKKSKSATEFFLRLGIDSSDWNNYRNEHFDTSKINLYNALNDDVIVKYTKLTNTVLLSSNTSENIYNILSRLNIPYTRFNDIISMTTDKGNKIVTKKNSFIEFSKKYHIGYNEILSIGDRYNTDIKPLCELGGYGVLINDCSSVLNLYNDLINGKLCTNEYYSLYTMEGLTISEESVSF